VIESMEDTYNNDSMEHIHSLHSTAYGALAELKRINYKPCWQNIK